MITATTGDAAGISVVIPTRNRATQLGACLGTVRRALGDRDELIVVDSASTDAAVQTVASGHGAIYLRCDLKGASRARNAGWRRASNEVIAFIDDDVEVAEDWARAYSAAFAAHPDVAFMTGYVGIPEHQLNTYERAVAEKLDEEAHVLDRAFAGIPGHSANMAARRGALEAVHGFDERLGAGGDFPSSEDADLFDRLYACGLVGRYEPTARGWHDQWRDRRALLKLDWAYGNGMGARVRKLLRSDPARARQAARVAYWSWGVEYMYEDLAAGRRFGALTTAVRVGAAVVGLVRALPVGQADGHLAPRQSIPARIAALRARRGQ